jgi:hypothetical protein
MHHPLFGALNNPMATKPIIDYTKSKMLTFDGYLVQMEQLATKAVKLQR